MARYNELLVGRYNRLAQKLFSLKGGASLVSVEDALIMGLSLFHGAENRYLESWNRFFSGPQLAAGAGQQIAFQWRNPASSNVVAVFEKLTMVNPGAAALPVVVSNAPTATDLASAFALTGSRLDPRGGGNPSLVASFAQVAAPGDLTVSSAIGTLPVNTFYELIATDIQEIPLLPGDAWRFRANLVNNSFGVIVIWRERQLEDSERT